MNLTSAGLKWLALAAVVAVCVGYLVFSATRTTAEYYRTVAEARADLYSNSDVRVLGVVGRDVHWLDGRREVRFTAAAGGSSMPVDYRGTVPDIFRPGIQVVVEGHMTRSGVFDATTLFAKCPSRFAAATPQAQR